MIAKYIDVGDGFGERIRKFRPCDTYDTYIHNEIIYREMTLRDVITNKQIDYIDRQWLVDQLVRFIGADRSLDVVIALGGSGYSTDNGDRISIYEMVDIIEHTMENHPDHEED